MGTPQRSPTVRTRRTDDDGVNGRLYRFWERNQYAVQLAVGGFLILVAIVVVIVAVQVKSTTDAQSSQAMHARTQAHVACVRTMEFAGPLGDYFARVHALDAKTLRDYRKLIPKSCP